MDIINAVKSSVPVFLGSLYRNDGFFSYSRDKDLHSPRLRWGLGNTVFAMKTYGILKAIDKLEPSVKRDCASFIKGFETRPGTFSDPLLHRAIALKNKLSGLKNLNFSDFFCQKTVMAETRQAFAALMLMGERPSGPFTGVPYSTKSADDYFRRLNWKNTWAAASHLSHLVFFYRYNSELFGYYTPLAGQLTSHCLEKLDSLQDEKEGLWFERSGPDRQKVNGAMKIISAFVLAQRSTIRYPEKIIDYLRSLKKAYYYDGCDNLNCMYVLCHAFESTGRRYKANQVAEFCQEALKRYERYFYPAEGGFSFLPDDSPRNYYGLKVTGRFSGPDLHGTMMFTWAVALAARTLGLHGDDFSEVVN